MLSCSSSSVCVGEGEKKKESRKAVSPVSVSPSVFLIKKSFEAGPLGCPGRQSLPRWSDRWPQSLDSHLGLTGGVLAYCVNIFKYEEQNSLFVFLTFCV